MSDDPPEWYEENTETTWYRGGYRIGAAETKRDAALLRLIGYGTVFAGALWDPLVTATFLTIYVGFTLLEYRDRRDEVELLREYEPETVFEKRREETEQ